MTSVIIAYCTCSFFINTIVIRNMFSAAVDTNNDNEKEVSHTKKRGMHDFVANYRSLATSQVQ